MKLSHFFNELKRRDVFRVATAYTVSSWLNRSEHYLVDLALTSMLCQETEWKHM